MKKYIGIDIGGSFIKYGIISSEGEVLEQKKIPTKRMDPEKILDDLVLIINEYKTVGNIVGVGISLPGVIDTNNKLLTSGSLLNMFKYDVYQILNKRTNMPISLINDAKAMSYAENWVGIGKVYNNFVCLPLGTGVGGSIVLNGQVIQGRSGASGEFGMMLMGQGKSKPISHESASFYCGVVAGLCRFYNNKAGNVGFENWETDVLKIMELAEVGDKFAKESVEEFYSNVAVLLLNICVAIDPEVIVIGGGISENTEIMNGIEQSVKDLISRYPEITALGLPKIVACQLGNNAGMIGAVGHFIKGEI